MNTDDFYICGPSIRTLGKYGTTIATDDHLRLKAELYVCPKCLRKFQDGIDSKHINHCHPRFSQPTFRKLAKLIVHVTPESPEPEKLICERLSKCSAIDQRYPHPVLHKDKWIRNGWHLQTYLLTDHEEIASYIVIGRVHALEHDEFGLFHKDIIADMFTAAAHRKHGNMTLLLPVALKDTGHTFNSVWFQDPISERGEYFLNKMAEKTGLPYRTI